MTTSPPIELVRNELIGYHLKATADISGGEVLVKEEAELSSTMLLSTIQYKKGLHVNLPVDGYIWRTQHMCEPNCYLLVQGPEGGGQEGDKASVSLISTKDIRKGDCLGYDYNTTEVILSTQFQCACGSLQCHRNVAGFHFMAQQQRKLLVERVGVHTLSPAVADAWAHR